MNLRVFDDKRELGREAARQAAAAIRDALREHNTARIIAATGASGSLFTVVLAKPLLRRAEILLLCGEAIRPLKAALAARQADSYKLISLAA